MPENVSVVNYQVDIVKGKVYFNDEEVKVRPKSFELLKLLLASPNEVISKDIILSTIWDDVTVDEQVIFQSVKELRKAFSSIDAIKTHPRKGYQWIADVDIVEQAPVSHTQGITPLIKPRVSDAQNMHQSVNIGNNHHSFGNKTKLTLLGAILALFCFILWFILSSNINENTTQGSDWSGSIIVLPVKDNLNDRGHKWVRIGAMDQLIQQIPPSDEYAVMQVDDVLDIMKRIPLSGTHFGIKEVEQLFVVSGASLVIETELNGTPGDYQLIYTLRRQQSIERGVLLTEEIYDGIEQLASIVADKLGVTTPTISSYHDNLANQLLTQALEQKNDDNFDGAQQYLKSLLAIEPSNLKAKRLLAEISVYLKDTEQITQLVDSVQFESERTKEMAPLKNAREIGRLRFWQGLNELQFGRFAQAITIFHMAEDILSEAQDWLYLGYLAESRGHLYRHKKQYVLASEYYQNAITNHRIIKCPFGEVNNLLYLAQTAFLQNKQEEAKTLADKAASIVKKRELVTLKQTSREAVDSYK